MVCEKMICDTYKKQPTNQFSISSDSYYGYVPCFKRENQQEVTTCQNCELETVDSTQQWYNTRYMLQEQQRPMKNRKRKLFVRDHEQPVALKRHRENEKTIATFVSPIAQEMDWQHDSSTDSRTVNCSTLEQILSASTGCSWAAGNSRLISKQEHNHSDGDDEWSGSNKDYEKLLFITHGCSIYHHQRAELLDNHITEF